MSAGLKLDYTRASSSGISANATTLTGLVTWRSKGGSVVHANLGRTSTSGDDSTNWALGYEHPLADKLQGTAEVYGSTGNSPGKQIGLRYEARQGLKLSAALGRNGGASNVFAGFSLEF